MSDPEPTPGANPDLSPDGNPDAHIQAEKPPATDAGIQANRPATALPPALAQATFLARMRRLLDMHNEMNASKGKPSMWMGAQMGGYLFGAVLGYSAYQELVAFGLQKEYAAVGFLLLLFAGAMLPDVLLKVVRKVQYNTARDGIVEFIERTLRNYPDEVEHCGGVSVLADRVELEALIHVLQDKFPQPAEAPMPPLKP